MNAPKLRVSEASGRTLDDPTDTQVYDLFADLNARWSFAIVDRLDREPEGQFYFQVRLDYVDSEGSVDYEVEFRAGSPVEHYAARISGANGFAGMDLVHKVYRAWRADDPALRDLVSWAPVDFD
ncbi:hypothetical protein [Nocardia concava]|uniref:hypothetical protein n=1 Tax=Nocardia concava TaxID=257281 RepID=UPI0012FB1087|nr:hypothetical protein [Nocardia concava]